MIGAAPRPYWQIGKENFQHGAAVRKERERFRTMKECKHSDLNELNLDPHRLHAKRWTSGELQELWILRYEVKPKATYDQLAQRFGNIDTQVVVEALVEMRNRKQAGIDMYKPFGTNDGSKPQELKKPAPKPKPKPKTKLLTMPSEPKVHEKTKQMVIYRGMGLSLTQISNEMGMKLSTVTNSIARVRRRHPGLYNDLLEKGRRAKE